MRRIDLLDYSRLFAALSVVAFHYLFQYDQQHWAAPAAKYGYLGVELFFIISGYVIFFSAMGKTAGEFAASRAIRLYPAFWVAVPLTVVAILASGGQVTLPQLAANLTMAPKLFGIATLDGVYWTLLYELSFYAAVTLVLLTPLRKHLEALFLLWPLAMLAAFATGHGNRAFLGGYYAFFAAGALFAMMRDRITLALLVSLAATLFLCVLGTLDRALALEAARMVPLSAPVLVGAILALFAFFFVLNTQRGQRAKLPAAQQAGRLTYPLYLVHNGIGLALMGHLPLWTVFLVVLALAYGVNALVERRLASMWRALFNALVARPLAAVAPSAQLPA